MTKDGLLTWLRSYKNGEIGEKIILAAVDEYSSASNNGKPIVSGSLPTSAEIATAAQLYAGCKDIGTEDEFVYAAGHFVAGATWMFVQAGGNDH